MAGGEAEVALHVLTHKRPECRVFLVGIGPGTGDDDLQINVDKKDADGQSNSHGGAEAPRLFEEYKRQRQQNQECALPAQKGDQFHDLGHEIAAPLVELVDQQGYAVVKSGENRVEPGGDRGQYLFNRHKHTPLLFVSHILTQRHRESPP